MDIHAHGGVAAQIGADHRGQRLNRGRGHAGDLQAAGAQALHGLHGGTDGLQVPHHLPVRCDHRLPGLGQFDAPADAMEQQGVQFALQVADRLGERWLREVQRGGRATEAAVIDHCQEVFELPCVH